MKAKKYDWIVKVARVNSDNRYVINYINVLASTRQEVLEYANTLVDYSLVRIYKFEAVL